MFKTLIKTYIESRLNSIDKEIEELSEILVDEETKATSTISKVTFEYSSQTTKRIKKLRIRMSLYLILFGEIK